MIQEKQNSNPEIIIPKGYLLTDLMDTDDTGYGYEDEAVYTGEVSVQFE